MIFLEKLTDFEMTYWTFESDTYDISKQKERHHSSYIF